MPIIHSQPYKQKMSTEASEPKILLEDDKNNGNDHNVDHHWPWWRNPFCDPNSHQQLGQEEESDDESAPGLVEERDGSSVITTSGSIPKNLPAKANTPMEEEQAKNTMDDSSKRHRLLFPWKINLFLMLSLVIWCFLLHIDFGCNYYATPAVAVAPKHLILLESVLKKNQREVVPEPDLGTPADEQNDEYPSRSTTISVDKDEDTPTTELANRPRVVDYATPTTDGSSSSSSAIQSSNNGIRASITIIGNIPEKMESSESSMTQQTTIAGGGTMTTKEEIGKDSAGPTKEDATSPTIKLHTTQDDPVERDVSPSAAESTNQEQQQLKVQAKVDDNETGSTTKNDSTPPGTNNKEIPLAAARQEMGLRHLKKSREAGSGAAAPPPSILSSSSIPEGKTRNNRIFKAIQQRIHWVFPLLPFAHLGVTILSRLHWVIPLVFFARVIFVLKGDDD